MFRRLESYPLEWGDLWLSILLEATDAASDCNAHTAPGAVGVVHAARQAQLDPTHAQRIVGITDTGDQGLIALRACQAYVRAITHWPTFVAAKISITQKPTCKGLQ